MSQTDNLPADVTQAQLDRRYLTDDEIAEKAFRVILE